MDEIQTELDETTFYFDPRRQLLDSRSVHTRLRKLCKLVQRLQMQMMIHDMYKDIKEFIKGIKEEDLRGFRDKYA